MLNQEVQSPNIHPIANFQSTIFISSELLLCLKEVGNARQVESDKQTFSPKTPACLKRTDGKKH